MPRLWMRLSLAFLAALLFAQPVAAQAPTTVEITPAEIFATRAAGVQRHLSSGYDFPDHLGDMPRRKYRIWAPNDVAVNYTLRGGGNGDPWLDVYVYPAPRPGAEEASGVEASLLDNLHGAPITDQPPLPLTASDGFSRWFSGDYENRRVTTGYVLVKRGGWYILARGTAPAESGSDGLARLHRAIATIDWAWSARN